MKKVYIYGWYGGGNLGDDFMMEAVCNYLHQNNIEPYFCHNNHNYFEVYPALREMAVLKWPQAA